MGSKSASSTAQIAKTQTVNASDQASSVALGTRSSDNTINITDGGAVESAVSGVKSAVSNALNFGGDIVKEAFYFGDSNARRAFDFGGDTLNLAESVVRSSSQLTESNQSFLGQTFSSVLNMVGDQSARASANNTGLALEAVEFAKDTTVAGDRKITKNLITAAAVVAVAMVAFGVMKK